MAGGTARASLPHDITGFQNSTWGPTWAPGVSFTLTSPTVGLGRPTTTALQSAALQIFKTSIRGLETGTVDSKVKTCRHRTSPRVSLTPQAPFKRSNLILTPFFQPKLRYHVMGAGRGVEKRSGTFNSRETKLSVFHFEFAVSGVHESLKTYERLRRTFYLSQAQVPLEDSVEKCRHHLHTQSKCDCCLPGSGVGRISPKKTNVSKWRIVRPLLGLQSAQPDAWGPLPSASQRPDPPPPAKGSVPSGHGQQRPRRPRHPLEGTSKELMLRGDVVCVQVSFVPLPSSLSQFHPSTPRPLRETKDPSVEE